MEKEKDDLILGGHAFQSRFILGSGKYSLDLIEAAVREAGAQIITLAVRRANTKDRENARTADTVPLDSAVNIPLAKILNPIKRSAAVQIRFPATAKSQTGLSGRANTDTSGLVNRKEPTAVITEITAITLRLSETSFLSFPRFCSP